MGPPGSGKPKVDEVREQDRFLPIANISRIMKKSLPPNAKIAKDAKETVQECVSEFISFVTSEASEKCQKEKRKTINGTWQQSSDVSIRVVGIYFLLLSRLSLSV